MAELVVLLACAPLPTTTTTTEDGNADNERDVLIVIVMRIVVVLVLLRRVVCGLGTAYTPRLVLVHKKISARYRSYKDVVVHICGTTIRGPQHQPATTKILLPSSFSQQQGPRPLQLANPGCLVTLPRTRPAAQPQRPAPRILPPGSGRCSAALPSRAGAHREGQSALSD